MPELGIVAGGWAGAGAGVAGVWPVCWIAPGGAPMPPAGTADTVVGSSELHPAWRAPARLFHTPRSIGCLFTTMPLARLSAYHISVVNELEVGPKPNACWK